MPNIHDDLATACRYNCIRRHGKAILMSAIALKTIAHIQERGDL